jgi:hypothetical protein
VAVLEVLYKQKMGEGFSGGGRVSRVDYICISRSIAGGGSGLWGMFVCIRPMFLTCKKETRKEGKIKRKDEAYKKEEVGKERDAGKLV